jgi:hypothetical protein
VALIRKLGGIEGKRIVAATAPAAQ